MLQNLIHCMFDFAILFYAFLPARVYAHKIRFNITFAWKEQRFCAVNSAIQFAF